MNNMGIDNQCILAPVRYNTKTQHAVPVSMTPGNTAYVLLNNKYTSLLKSDLISAPSVGTIVSVLFAV